MNDEYPFTVISNKDCVCSIPWENDRIIKNPNEHIQFLICIYRTVLDSNFSMYAK